MVAEGTADIDDTQPDEAIAEADAEAEPDRDPAPLDRAESADLTDLQWHLGTSAGMRNSDDPFDINIPAGMDDTVADGSDAPVIAVVDTGVDYTNPALAPNMIDLSQYGSLMADTGCGVYGIDATQPAGSEAFADPMDTNSHGTHVAGIIAANGDVEGVNPHARIVAVRVIADSGSVYTSAIVRGLGWLVEAKAAGVNIQGLNFSIGGMTGVTYAARAAFALAEENGIVAFAAAGNNGNNVDDSDTVLTAVQAGSTVVVDAAEANGEPSYFSNYGKLSTDVFSPGSGIMATTPVSLSTYYPAVAKRYGESLVYEGFEPEGAAEDADVNGGFTFSRLDEEAEDGCGEPIASTGERFYLGTESLPVELEAAVGPASPVLTWNDRLLVVAEGLETSNNDVHITAIDPATGAIDELGTVPYEVGDAAVSKDALYLHIPGDILDASSLDHVLVCPLDDFGAARMVELPGFDRSLPYSIRLAASNGDLAILNMPGYPEALDGVYADVWTLEEGGSAVVPSDIKLQQGGSATATALVVGDTLYVWGISHEVDTRTYFRSLPLAALGREAEPVPVDPKPTDPTAPQTPATLDKLASTGDGSALWLIVGATAASGAIAAACAAYGERRQRQTRRPLR